MNVENINEKSRELMNFKRKINFQMTLRIL